MPEWNVMSIVANVDDWLALGSSSSTLSLVVLQFVCFSPVVLSGCHSSPHFIQSNCEDTSKCALVLQEGARLQQVSACVWWCVCGRSFGIIAVFVFVTID